MSSAGPVHSPPVSDVAAASGLDEVIHPIIRLKICGLLAPVTEARFGELRDLLGLSDSVLSKHLAVLAKANYISYRRGSVDGRKRLWVTLTSAGRQSFAAHIAAISKLSTQQQDREQGGVEDANM